MKIKGTAEYIERVRSEAPDDGVHKTSAKTGLLKGCHSLLLNGKILPKGQTAIYYRSSKSLDKGYKVFLNIDEGWVFKYKIVKKEWRNRAQLFRAGIAPRPHKMVPVDVDIKYRGNRWHRKCWAIKTDHVCYPEDAWEKYANGYPYDFNCLDPKEHPSHNPEGFLHFKEKVLRALKKTGVVICDGKPSLKLGDIVYDINKKRWFLVDCG